MATVREINAAEYLPATAPLMREHWLEVAKDTGVPEPQVNPAIINALQAAGALVTLGVFDDDNTMVGYSLNVLGPPIDFANMIVMQNEGIFVRPEHRGRIALRLISESERIAKERGATRAIWHTYMDSRADALFSGLPGYRAFDHPYSKEL